LDCRGGIVLTALGGLTLIALPTVVFHRKKTNSTQVITPLKTSSEFLKAEERATPPKHSPLSSPKSTLRVNSAEKQLEIQATVYFPKPLLRSIPSLSDHYTDPFGNLQTQEQFETKLFALLEKIQNECAAGKYNNDDECAELALLSTSWELCKYSIPLQMMMKIDVLLQDALLPQGITFILRQLLNEQNPVLGKEKIQIQQEVHFCSRSEMGLYGRPGITSEKQLAVIASEIIEGYDFGKHGLRIAVHQRPGPRTAALIRCHLNEFLSRQRNFVFTNKPDEAEWIRTQLSPFLTNEQSSKIPKIISVMNKQNIFGQNRCKTWDKLIDTTADLSPTQKQEAKDRIHQVYYNRKSRCSVMLYILDALKKGRHHYYSRYPEYFKKDRLTEVLKGYACEDHLPPAIASSESMVEITKNTTKKEKALVIPSGEERYLFEAAAQHLENMREALHQVNTDEQFELLAAEFYAHYRLVYDNLPTFSLSVAATIYPGILLATSDKQVQFYEKGVVPQVLLDLQKASLTDSSTIFQSFQKLNDHFSTFPQFGSLVDHLDRAVVQIEYYTELDPLGIQPKEQIDPLYQPQVIFDAVDALRSFLHSQEAQVSSEIQQEIKKCTLVLEHLEQQAARIVLEQVRTQNSLGKRGLDMVEQVARRKKILKPEESVNDFLQHLSDESLRGYQNLRQQLYNSEIAMRWLEQSNQQVEGLFQKTISTLNSGFVGILSQLVSFSIPSPSGAYLGGHALKQGIFYGVLDVEPQMITAGKIALLTVVPHNLMELKTAAGIIVEEGGPLSHAAHIARELAIPMVIGAKGAVERLKSLNSQSICFTLDNTGNKIEPYPQPFPSTVSTGTNVAESRKMVQKDHAGGKGKQLIQLSSLFDSLPTIDGIQLTFPSFMVLGLDKEIADFYATSWQGTTLKVAIEQVINSPEKIWDLIEKCPFPFSLEKYSKELKMSSDTPLIARSSAAVEDGASSFAGLFDSIPNLSSLPALEKGIKQVLFSAFAPKVMAYVKERNLQDYSPFDTAVIIQQYIADAEISGVALSKDPIQASDVVRMQLVKGVGGGVDAQGHPDSVAVDAQSNVILYALPSEKSLLLKPKYLRKVSALIRELETLFQFPVDVEFAIKKDQDDQMILYLLQVRPIVDSI